LRRANPKLFSINEKWIDDQEALFAFEPRFALMNTEEAKKKTFTFR
jgi:hypothetical protein